MVQLANDGWFSALVLMGVYTSYPESTANALLINVRLFLLLRRLNRPRNGLEGKQSAGPDSIRLTLLYSVICLVLVSV